jgi:hypothetical protein
MLDTTLSDVERMPLKLKNLIVTALDEKLGHMWLAWGNDSEKMVRDLPAGGFSGDNYFGPIKKSDEMAPYARTVMAIDPSGRGKDETAYAIVRYLNGVLFLVDSGGFVDGYSETTLKALAARALRFGVNDVIGEENYGGGMFNNLLKPHLYALKAGQFDPEWKGWSVGQKEIRILDILEPIVGSHRLVVDRRVIEEDAPLLQNEKTKAYSLIYQFTRMWRERGALAHEDRLEAVAMACEYFSAKMGVDQKKGEERRKQALTRQGTPRVQQSYVGHTGQPSASLALNREAQVNEPRIN